MRRHYGYLILAILLSCAAATGQQRQRPPAGPARSPIAGLAKTQAPIAAPYAGNVEGFVYWDASAIAHKPAGTCDGLAITVSVGSSSGPFESYKPMATLSNNFKYAGQVKAFLANGKIALYDVCMYAYDHLPVGPDLQVQLTVTQPMAFSPVVTPQFATMGPIKIVNGQCNMLPKVVPSSVSDLTAHWGSCQNRAYYVNFALLHPQMLHTLSAGSGSGGMMSGALQAPQRGMLSPEGQPAMQQPNSSGSAHPVHGQLLPERRNQQAPLTNAEVINMVKGGLSESIIIAKIQSSQGKFDLSPAGCRSLRSAHVSEQILDAMGDGSQRPCFTGAVHSGNGADDLNPQPLPPHGAVNVRNAQTLSSAPPKALRKITNSRLLQQDAAIIATLQQQRHAADQESVAMKLGLHSAPASSQNLNSAAALLPSTKVQRGTNVGSIGPEHTTGATVNSMVRKPQLNTVALTCSHDPTPRILKVSGGEGPGVLTPEGKYNLYTIIGCSFGPSRAGNSVHIYGKNGFLENLNIDFWSDNGITVHFDPFLAGVLDQDDVALVIAPAGRQPFQKSGFKFYAARGVPGPDGNPQEVPLRSIPQREVSLAGGSPILAGYGKLPQNAASKFRFFWSFQGTPVGGWVFRYVFGHGDMSSTRTAECFLNNAPSNDDNLCTDFGVGKYGNDIATPPELKPDLWDFSKLVPGFWISSYQLFIDSPDDSQLCGAWDDNNKNALLLGTWDYSLNAQNQILVNWPVNFCGDHEANFAGRWNMAMQSAYGLAVWVMGPRCVDPWTGEKDQRCADQVRKLLGS